MKVRPGRVSCKGWDRWRPGRRLRTQAFPLPKALTSKVSAAVCMRPFTLSSWRRVSTAWAPGPTVKAFTLPWTSATLACAETRSL